MSRKKPLAEERETMTKLSSGIEFQVAHDLSGVVVDTDTSLGDYGENPAVKLSWADLDELWKFCTTKAPSARMKDLQTKKDKYKRELDKYKRELSDIESQINTLKIANKTR